MAYVKVEHEEFDKLLSDTLENLEANYVGAAKEYQRRLECFSKFSSFKKWFFGFPYSDPRETLQWYVKKLDKWRTLMFYGDVYVSKSELDELVELRTRKDWVNVM